MAGGAAAAKTGETTGDVFKARQSHHMRRGGVQPQNFCKKLTSPRAIARNTRHVGREMRSPARRGPNSDSQLWCGNPKRYNVESQWSESCSLACCLWLGSLLPRKNLNSYFCICLDSHLNCRRKMIWLCLGSVSTFLVSFAACVTRCGLNGSCILLRDFWYAVTSRSALGKTVKFSSYSENIGTQRFGNHL